MDEPLSRPAVPAPSASAFEPATAGSPAQPAPTILPTAWVRLDDQGRLLSAAEGWMSALHAPFVDSLTAACRVLWETVLWPVLRAQGGLREALLEVSGAAPGGAADSAPSPWLSHWCAEQSAGALGYLGVLSICTERQRLANELRRAQQSLDAMPGALLQLQLLPGGRLELPYASDRLLDLLGVSPWQAAAKPERFYDALVPASRSALMAAAAKAEHAASPSWSVVLTPQRAPQRRFELQAQRAEEPGLWHATLFEVSEREALRLEGRLGAGIDPPCSLPNRLDLLEQLRRRLQGAEAFAVFCLGSNGVLKLSNSLGEGAAEELLGQLLQRLRRPLSWAVAGPGNGPDSVVPWLARTGEQQFVLLVDGLYDPQAAATLAANLVQVMAQPYQVQGLEIVAAVGLGVALAGPDSEPEHLLRDANIAMDEARRRVPPTWLPFEPEMQQRGTAALLLEADLRVGLRLGQLRPVFQPIVEMASGRVVGMEALARWHHPARGEISPLQFVPVAESSGLVGELGAAMLGMACTQFAAWRKQGLAVPPRLSVNLSRAQLNEADLPERIAAVLAAAGLPCSCLQLEVTETLAVDDESALMVLLALRALGVQLALDDFGTGQSSLASLHHLPVQQIKIDRSFVHGIDSSVYYRALVQATLQVAQALDLEVVAEGVETVAQAQKLFELGCQRAQGWLYARALEAEQVPAFLRQGGARVLRPAAGAQPAASEAPRGGLGLDLELDGHHNNNNSAGAIPKAPVPAEHDQGDAYRNALAAAAERSRLLATVSHELRMPLNAVVGFAQLLRDPGLSSQPAQQSKWAQGVLDAGLTLVRLVDDLETLGHIEARPLRAPLQVVPLLPCLRAAWELARVAGRRADVVLHPLVLDEALPPSLQVQLDPQRLQQVLLNLLSNALKFQRSGGSVWLSAHPAGAGCRIEVRDDGPGIAPEQVARLFTGVFRAGRDSGPGSGLGLAISRAMVVSMGGSLRLEDTLGGGCTFVIELQGAAAAA